MKRMLPLLILLTGTAVAALPGLPSTDPSKLGADVFALSGALIFVVQLIKAQAERAGRPLRSWVTLALTFGLAEAAAAGLFYTRFGASFGELPPPWGWVIYGALAFAIAAGARDFVVALIERNKGAAGVPVTQAATGTTVVAITPPTAQPGDILPPAGLVQPAQPPVSGYEPLRGFLSPEAAQNAGAIIRSPMVEAIVRTALIAAGLEVSAANLMNVAGRLLPVAPDLLDGDPHLSTDNLNHLAAVILQLKAEHAHHLAGRA